MVGDVADRPERYVTLDAEQAARVAHFINQRMASIPGMNQSRLRKESGVSDATLRPLMNGVERQYWPDKLRLVSTALGWAADGIERVAAGGEPEEIDDQSTTPRIEERFDQLDERLDRMERALAEALAALAQRLGGPG